MALGKVVVDILKLIISLVTSERLLIMMTFYSQPKFQIFVDLDLDFLKRLFAMNKAELELHLQSLQSLRHLRHFD